MSIGLELSYALLTKYTRIALSLKQTINDNPDIEILDELEINSWSAAQSYLKPRADKVDELRKLFERTEVSSAQRLNDTVRDIQKREGEDVNDVFYTPETIATKMVAMAKKYSKSGDTWMEPCKGGGALLSVFPDPDNSIRWELVADVDFFQDNRMFDICVTNPPFSIYTAFLERILFTHPRVIVLLFGCLNLTPKRMKMLMDEGYVLVDVHQCYWNVILGTCFLHCWVLKENVDDTTTTFTMDTFTSKSKIGGDKDASFYS